MSTEGVVYLLRKTSLTRSEIGKLRPEQLNAILKEVAFQESIEQYQHAHSVASLLAAIYNTIPRKSKKALTAKDFLSGEPPQREYKPRASLETLAEKKGIKLPSK